MEDIKRALGQCRAVMPEIWMPKKGTDMAKWAVIACDQYTSEPAYWEGVEKQVDGAPSALRLVLPEYCLGQSGEEECIDKIHLAMKQYAQDGTLQTAGEGCVLVRRETQDGIRLGLMLALDLEHYDYSPESQSAIRPTEGTIKDRIPPRLKVRDGAIFEVPHIMVLVDDKDRTLIEPLMARKDEFLKLYDFDLMKEGGHVEGWFIPESSEGAKEAAAALQCINEKQKSRSKSPILFAVGDGNHSLATAKAHYENIKAAGCNTEGHPARYALVEVVNLHDAAVCFHPIHRAVFGGAPDLPQYLQESLGAQLIEGGEELPRLIAKDVQYAIHLPDGGAIEAIRNIECALNEYAKEHAGTTIDYIHGEAAISEMAEKGGCTAVLMPKVEKEDLFPYVEQHGPLPRKAFSIGHADDKRFYIEIRKIVPGGT